VDVFLKNAQGINYNNLDPFTSELAYNAFLIDTLPGSTNRYYKLLPPQQGMNQSKYLTSSGSMGETGFSFAGNYMNKLYIGGTLGFSKIKYNETSDYREYKNESDTAFSLNNFTYNEELSSRGTGFNFKLGIIYRPTDWIRIGGALHTPTYYSMSDDYVVSLRSQFDQNYNYSPSAQSSSFNYSIVTPARAIASVGFVIAKKGLINAEYEHIDYRTTRFFPSRDFNGLNSAINNSLQTSSNVKIGAEIRFDPFVIRGGYAIYGDPYGIKSPFTSLKNFYTGGVGYRTNNWYVDFAFVFNTFKTNYYLYDPSFVQAAQNKYLNQSLICTIGFRF